MGNTTNKILNELATQRGYNVSLDVVVIPGEFPVGVSLVPGNNFYAVAVSIDPASLTKDGEKAFKKAVKPYGKPGIDKTNGILQVLVSGMGKKSIISKIEAAAAAMPSLVRESGAARKSVCLHCGATGCDTLFTDKGVPVPAHSACVNEHVNKLLYEVEDNRLNGNYLFATIAAVVGAIVGCVPSFITIYYMQLISGWLFALIPLASAFAYRRAGGIQSKVMPVIVSIISLASSAALFFIANYVILSEAFREQYKASLSVDMYMQIMTDPSVRGEAMTEFFKVMAFCVLGIVISWSSMSRTNTAKLKELKAMRDQQSAISPQNSDRN